MTLPLLAPDALSGSQRALYDTIAGGPRAGGPVPLVDAAGHLTGPFNALLYAPSLGEAVQALGTRLRFGSSLSDRERELATLLVAARIPSPYELSAHRTLALATGLDRSTVDTVSRGELPDLEDPRERALLRLCATLIDNPAEATSDLGEQLLVELTILVGYYQLLARLLVVAGVD
jgi:4-carboxymuconolactone decarboxylase